MYSLSLWSHSSAYLHVSSEASKLDGLLRLPSLSLLGKEWTNMLFYFFFWGCWIFQFSIFSLLYAPSFFRVGLWCVCGFVIILFAWAQTHAHTHTHCLAYAGPDQMCPYTDSTCLCVCVCVSTLQSDTPPTCSTLHWGHSVHTWWLKYRTAHWLSWPGQHAILPFFSNHKGLLFLNQLHSSRRQTSIEGW